MWWIWVLIGSGFFIGLIFVIIKMVQGAMVFTHLYAPWVLKYFPVLESESLKKGEGKEKEEN
ncbi:MAG: hypothetical protein ACPLXL_02160 [Minisyncoccia bacterium]